MEMEMNVERVVQCVARCMPQRDGSLSKVGVDQFSVVDAANRAVSAG